MGCASSTEGAATKLPDGAEHFTYFEHSKLAYAELRRGQKAIDPKPADDVLMRALFQSSALVIKKLDGSGTEEIVKLADPSLTSVHHILEYKKHGGGLPGKTVLITSGAEAWLLFFSGTKLIQNGTVYVHKLASKEKLPVDPKSGHAMVIKMSADKGWLLYDGIDTKDTATSLLATAKDAGLAFCGIHAQVAPGRADTGFLLALLIGTHLLVMTQTYYRPSEKRALGPKGSLGVMLGSAMVKSVVGGLNPVSIVTDP